MTDKEYELVNGLSFMIHNSNMVDLVKEHFYGKYGNSNPHELLEDYLNYGGRTDNKNKTWHIDHIIPHSKFSYTSMDDPIFLKCWDLSNLRPLEKIENIKKGCK